MRPNGQFWHLALPWVLLSKRTQYQPDLGATPAELVFGQTLTVPGDLTGSDLPPDSTLPQILEKVRKNAARPPVQTSHHTTTPKDYMPKDLATCSHVWVRKPDAKKSPLGPAYDGPYEILERQGSTCVVVRVGSFANGAPRTEKHHLENCKPMYFMDEPYSVDKPKLGRPSAPAPSVVHDEVENSSTAHHPPTAPSEENRSTRPGPRRSTRRRKERT